MKVDEIKSIRLKLGLTQNDFAHQIGVMHCTVNRWENNKSKPTRLAIEKMKLLLKNHKGKYDE